MPQKQLIPLTESSYKLITEMNQEVKTFNKQIKINSVLN